MYLSSSYSFSCFQFTWGLIHKRASELGIEADMTFILRSYTYVFCIDNFYNNDDWFFFVHTQNVFIYLWERIVIFIDVDKRKKCLSSSNGK